MMMLRGRVRELLVSLMKTTMNSWMDGFDACKQARVAELN
jgi:hypothetical protein